MFNWLSSEVIALVLSAASIIIAGKAGLMYGKITKTLKELGEFLAVLGAAADDNKYSREEIAKIIKEGADILAVWKLK